MISDTGTAPTTDLLHAPEGLIEPLDPDPSMEVRPLKVHLVGAQGHGPAIF